MPRIVTLSRRAQIAVKRRRRQQYAALPMRVGADGSLAVLLITSRETRRWVLPKGWAERGVPAPEQAAREAFEEAGVEGEIATKPLGRYGYDKQLRAGRSIPVRVDVYALRVVLQHADWPEKGQREAIWVAPEAAAGLVDEPALAAILRELAGSYPAPARAGATTELRPTA